MKYSSGCVGRVFVIRLEDGDSIPSAIEQFAEKEGVLVGQAILIGGIGSGRIVAGPKDSEAPKPEPMLVPIEDAHEVLGVGVLAPGPDGKPMLHIHAALGRGEGVKAGCLRPGVQTWLVGEVILYEILGVPASRPVDERSGFALLEPNGPGGGA